MKHYFKLLFFTALMAVGCQIKGENIDRVEKHTILKMYRLSPNSVHDVISPRTRAILSNGDTIPCTENHQIGDTITYIYYDYRTGNN